MQEDILRELSGEIFLPTKPNSFGLHEFGEFIEGFVSQLAESPQMDSAQIYTALVTRFFNFIY